MSKDKREKIYLLRSYGADMVMRDGEGKGAPVYHVTRAGWTPFRQLPLGVRLEMDPDVEVQVVDALPEGVTWAKSKQELTAERRKAGKFSAADLNKIKQLRKVSEKRPPRPDLIAKAAKELREEFGLEG
jgi:hypothetical protein